MLSTARPQRQPRRSRRPLPQRLRLAIFQLFYGPAALHYDRLAAWAFLGEWERWQRAALPLLPQRGLIVELGAGTGALASLGSSPGRIWLGIEPSIAMLRVARRRRGRTPNARFWLVRAMGQHLPLADGAADAVLATFPAPYIAHAVTAAEIRRVLRPGGSAVIVLDGRLARDSRARRLRHLALRLFYGKAYAETDNTPFRLPGFDGRVAIVPTAHGSAHIYVGRPAPSPREPAPR